ncbi:MAG: hypothetical protein ACE5J9_06170 [Methanosarcinales archaeon]
MMQKKIYELAKQYLIENIGNLISAGDVYYDAMHNTWNAKIAGRTFICVNRDIWKTFIKF